jgi:hypothetical protein
MTKAENGSLAHRFSGLGKEKKDGLEITRLDLLPPNFVESHFGDLLKTSAVGTNRDFRSGSNRDIASVRRSLRTHEPKIDPTQNQHFDLKRGKENGIKVNN